MLGDISVAGNIYIVCGTTDMRKSIDGLCNIVKDKLSMDSDQPSLFLLCGKRCDRIKVLLHEPEFIELNAGKKKCKPKASYDELFANLPVCRVEADTLTEEQKFCPVCQGQMIPTCKETDDPQFIKDEGLPALIPDGYASSSLVSHIMYEKYADALPLYR